MARRRRRPHDNRPGSGEPSALAQAERRRQSALARAEAAALDGDKIAEEYARQEADHWLRVLNAIRHSHA
jgi:hypothetical protein